jgi:hypothetical protein
VIAAAAGDAVGFDGDVSKLSGHAVHPVEDFSARTMAPPMPVPRVIIAMLSAAARSQPLFAEGSDFGVVVKKDAGAQAALDFIAHRIVGPAGKIGGLAHHPGFHVDDAGDADAGPDKFAAPAILSVRR